MAGLCLSLEEVWLDFEWLAKRVRYARCWATWSAEQVVEPRVVRNMSASPEEVERLPFVTNGIEHDDAVVVVHLAKVRAGVDQYSFAPVAATTRSNRCQNDAIGESRPLFSNDFIDPFAGPFSSDERENHPDFWKRSGPVGDTHSVVMQKLLDGWLIDDEFGVEHIATRALGLKIIKSCH